MLTCSVPLSSLGSDSFLIALEESFDLLVDCIPADHRFLGVYANLGPDFESRFSHLISSLREFELLDEVSLTLDSDCFVCLSSQADEPSVDMHIFDEINLFTTEWNSKSKLNIKPAPKSLIVRFKGLVGVPGQGEDWDSLLKEQIISVVSGEEGSAWLEIEDELFLVDGDKRLSECFKKKDTVLGKLGIDLSPFRRLCEGKSTRLLNLDLWLQVNVNSGTVREKALGRVTEQIRI